MGNAAASTGSATTHYLLPEFVKGSRE